MNEIGCRYFWEETSKPIIHFSKGDREFLCLVEMQQAALGSVPKWMVEQFNFIVGKK